MSIQPNWLSAYPAGTGKVEGVNFGFDVNGMWFNASSGDPAYPIRTNVEFKESDVTEIVFTFLHDKNCSDHGVCFFKSGVDPVWDWDDSNYTRIAFQTECNTPQLAGLTQYIEDDNYNLEYSSYYTCRLIYDPLSKSTTSLLYSGKTADSDPVSELSIIGDVFDGPYAIGFDADQDNKNYKSYFTNITIFVNGLELYHRDFSEFLNHHPWPMITFRVKTYDPIKLIGQNPPDNNIQNIIKNYENQTVWIENWPAPLKHGDEFTLYGKEAKADTRGTEEAQRLGQGPDIGPAKPCGCDDAFQ
jgi:hypothetical protein